jgi:hypothetical protein
MIALWYLLVLAPFVAVPILWWNYRRKVAEREHVASARWGNLASAARTGATVAEDPPQPAPAVQPRYARRERLLDPVQTLLYYLLKNGLPDHEVMPQVGLAQLLDVPGTAGGGERDLRLHGLAQHRVDFVICNKALQPVAAIDLLEHEAPAALTAAPDFKSQCLAQAGIRHLRLVRTALPKRQDVRALVLG